MNKAARKTQRLLKNQTKRFDTLVAKQLVLARKNPKRASVPQSKLKKMVENELIIQRRDALTNDHAQWHRWYQEQKKRQRMLRSFRKSNKGQHVWSIPREAVL